MSPKTTPSAASARTLRERGGCVGDALLTWLLGAVAVVWLMGDPCRPVFPAHRWGAYSYIRRAVPSYSLKIRQPSGPPSRRDVRLGIDRRGAGGQSGSGFSDVFQRSGAPQVSNLVPT